MLKDILNLGVVLKRGEQRSINGGVMDQCSPTNLTCRPKHGYSVSCVRNGASYSCVYTSGGGE